MLLTYGIVSMMNLPPLQGMMVQLNLLEGEAVTLSAYINLLSFILYLLVMSHEIGRVPLLHMVLHI
jgi:hypothetical protein